MALTAVQEHLLREPRDAEAWAVLRGGGGGAGATAPAAAAPPLAAEPLRLQPLNAAGAASEGPRRPVRKRFHPHGSSMHETLVDRHLDQLADHVRAGRKREALNELGPELAERLGERLSDAEQLALAETAHRLGRHELAAPLLQRLVERGEQAPDLSRWARYFLAEQQRLDGDWRAAEESLTALTAEASEAGASELLGQGLNSLAWLMLALGRRDRLPELLRTLAALGEVGAGSDLELLGRVSSTLEWLDGADVDALSHARDLAVEAGLVAAIDLVQVSTCGSLLNIEGWIVDPGRQLRELFVIRGQSVERLDLSMAKASARTDLAEVLQRCGAGADHHPGFSLHRLATREARRPAQAGEAAVLFLVLHNGDQFCLRCPLLPAPLRTANILQVLDGAISSRCELRLPLVLQRAREVWACQVDRQLAQPAEHRRHGEAPARPQLSVVVPLYGRIDFMEFQLNWFNAWRRRQGANALPMQLIYVLDDPRLREAFESLVKRCRTLYSMPFETVVNPENMGYAGANNRGAGVATAELLLLLNSDVLPADDNSLPSMVETFRDQADGMGALGARLLFDNGGLQHGGMEFKREPDLDGDLAQVWLNEHPLKGVNVRLSAEECRELQEVEAVTGACLMLQRERYAALGGLSSRYVVGDFEDSDLCLRLRQQGLSSYVDRQAVFYHLERQSVGFGDTNDARKMKVVAANAFTHQQRWASAIPVLKSSRIE